MPGHVYAIVHTATGRGYIGSSCRVAGRLCNHRAGLSRGNHRNPYLQAAWSKYGANAFDFVILDECPPEELRAVEQAWIDLTQAADRRYGFNLSTTTAHPTMTPEGLARYIEGVRRAHTGRKYPPEHCLNISRGKRKLELQHAKGQPNSRPKKSKRSRGPLSKESLQRISLAAKQRYVDHPELRIAQSARASSLFEKLWQSPEFRARQQASRQKYLTSSRYRQQRSEQGKRLYAAGKIAPPSHVGKTRTKEVRQRISLGLREWHAKRKVGI